ncbi:MAG: hypothetical protein NUV77_20095 [Thermoguttaceae bacterium]|nr:hypothetical protein [Thermoguttaceae bacterium]
MAARKGVNRYPRPGERIAPSTLSPVLMEPAPSQLVAGTAVEGLRLCDLDESVWEKLPADTIHALADLVVARVAAGCARRVFNRRHFPRPPDGVTLHQLRLEHRTHLCLKREGFDEDPQSLGDHTIGEILSMRAFGPRCLVDLLSALETMLQRGHRLNQELTAEAERLSELPESVLARCDDSRFGSLLSDVDVEARTARELAERLIARNHDPPDTAYVIEKVRELRHRILAMPDWTLEEELIQIFASTPHPRNRDILIGYYGWRDGQPHTLAEIGARYGMTRERTRQICAKLVRRHEPAKILAPVMDRTLAFLAARLPCAVSRLEAELRAAGLTRVGLHLENVRSAGNLLGRPIPFAVVVVDEERLAVRRGDEALVPAVVEMAKKEVYYHGVATVDQLVESLSERFGSRASRAVVTETLQLLDGFCWLDKPGGWFRLASIGKHGLPRAVQKVLAVAGRVPARDLTAAIRRNRRMWKTPPPERVVVEFCRQMPGVRIEGDWIRAEPPLRWQDTLTGVEARLVEILKKHGPIMERGALEDRCVAEGMNRFSFHAFIACSPVIAQYGHSVYGLLGVQPAPASVQSILARQRADRAPARVLYEHGRTEDGRIWLGYRLSKAASTYAVITIPAALKTLVAGKFDLLASDGTRVGTLAAKDGRAWGLGAYLRRQGARVDDHVRVTLDLEKRQAVIAIKRP